ncbi:hypothetical protein SAY87_032111 [Trapa incisa]|uniref:Uncharacterized protein n=1 Tax=Trapa incisa TaxID=236973 RepID=A0AAN7KS91_9MYRT|nr:hypothetical protein SAY87_032111 [Trapa incisa]
MVYPNMIAFIRAIAFEYALIKVGSNNINFESIMVLLHAQALTLAALAGAAVVEYYDSKAGGKADKYSKNFP